MACQLGKKKVLTETFAGCGWDLSAWQTKAIAEAQYVGGVNLVCQHLLPPTASVNTPFVSFLDAFIVLQKWIPCHCTVVYHVTTLYISSARNVPTFSDVGGAVGGRFVNRPYEGIVGAVGGRFVNRPYYLGYSFQW